MEDFTLPEGDNVLEKWIAAIKAVNKHLNAGDLKGVGQVCHDAVDVLNDILPAIPDKIVYDAIQGLQRIFKKELDRPMMAGAVSIADMDKFFKLASNTMLVAMSKTKPTAETLN